MNHKAFGIVEGRLVSQGVRHITWCHVCATREATSRSGLCVRCDADARLLIASVFDASDLEF